MKIIDQIVDFLHFRSTRQIFEVTLGIGVITATISLGIIWNHIRVYHSLKSDMEKLNRLSDKLSTLIQQSRVLEKQQEEFNVLLEKDPSFKIKSYITNLIAEHSMQSKLSKDLDISIPRDLRDGYQEITASFAFVNTATQELVNFLYDLEKNPRIFLKEIAVTRVRGSNSIDAVVICGTVQQSQLAN